MIMKQICIGLLLYWTFVFTAKAQENTALYMLRSTSITITTSKTTNLIFPSAIKHVDRGSADVLALQAKEAGNVLMVKAAINQFKETNLSIITADGKLYSLDVLYDSLPFQTVYTFNTADAAATDNTILFSGEKMNDDQLKMYATAMLDNPKLMHGVWDSRWSMRISLDGIYIRDDVLFYQLTLDNDSPIDYDIDAIRFYIRDNKKGKRTATQEQVLQPLHIEGNITKVKGKSKNSVVVALQKFTIPDAKFLAIEVMEKSGGRHLLLKVHNNKIIRAKQLSELQ